MDQEMIQAITKAARHAPERVAQVLEKQMQDTKIPFNTLVLAIGAFEIGTNSDEAERLVAKLFAQRSLEALQLLQTFCTTGQDHLTICILLGKIIRYTGDSTKQAAVETVRQHRPEVLEIALNVGQGTKN